MALEDRAVASTQYCIPNADRNDDERVVGRVWAGGPLFVGGGLEPKAL